MDRRPVGDRATVAFVCLLVLFGGAAGSPLACNDRGTKVSTTDACYCKTGYAGDLCDTCADLFDRRWGPDSDCQPSLCKRDYCHNHGSQIGTLADGCQCLNCDTGYDGDRCGECDSRYEPSADDPSVCVPASCSPDFCSGHGTVAGNLVELCRCSPCVAGYVGMTCSTCAANHSYDAFGTCTPRACKASHCFGHGTPAGDQVAGCSCSSCAPGYAGPRCQACAAAHEAVGSTCRPKACAAGLCHGHGVPTGDMAAGCACQCTEAYAGAACTDCAAGFAEAGDACARECTVAVDCSGRATHASGTAGKCSCVCRPGYALPSCSACASQYARASDGRCAPVLCTASAACGGHGVASGNIIDGCSCSCHDGYAGGSCESCAADYQKATGECTPTPCDASDCSGRGIAAGNRVTGCSCPKCTFGYDGPVCGGCAAGYKKAGPNTCSPCSVVGSDCNERATAVTSVNGVCQCTCIAGYTGASCGTCAGDYHRDSEGNCAAKPCEPGYCGGHGTAGGDLITGCTCSCALGYTGAHCAGCASDYHKEGDSCTPAPCGRVDCANRGDASGTRPHNRCACACDTGYAGDRCQQCDAPRFSRAASTGCVPTPCKSSLACHGHGTATGDLVAGCACSSCHPGYAGLDCGDCAPNFAPSALAPTGAAASCQPVACPLNQCTGHGDVAGNMVVGCSCEGCHAGYAGAACASCAPGFHASGAPGGVCVPHAACPADYCTSHGTPAGNSVDGCACPVCKVGYTGGRCERCMSTHSNVTLVAAPWWACLPTPCPADWCRGRGAPFGSFAVGCQCRCEHPYAGEQCGECRKPQYEERDGDCHDRIPDQRTPAPVLLTAPPHCRDCGAVVADRNAAFPLSCSVAVVLSVMAWL